MRFRNWIPFFLPHLTKAHLMDPDNSSLGAFVGLEMSTDKTKMYRAVLEGLCFETKICFEVIQSLGIPVNKIVASGGCSKSEILMQTKADVLEFPVDILENPDAGIAALAMICAVADRKYENYKEASEYFVKTGRRYVPCKDYREKYRQYIKVYSATKELYKTL
ncbi:MAG: FGGY-family carbohydrate kinase [Candidatus Choladocola sp.]|nr:FGGY-family carbohydrate kinase [Candidatus Choladocola sp.]